MEFKLAGLEGGMQFDLHQVGYLVERPFSLSRLHVELPLILVVLPVLQELGGVAQGKFDHDSFLDQLPLGLNG